MAVTEKSGTFSQEQVFFGSKYNCLYTQVVALVSFSQIPNSPPDGALNLDMSY